MVESLDQLHRQKWHPEHGRNMEKLPLVGSLESRERAGQGPVGAVSGTSWRAFRGP